MRELEEAASRYGTPLPDTPRPPRREVESEPQPTEPVRNAIPVHAGQRVEVLLDPRNPRYAELPGQPRAPGGVWIAGVILASLATVFTLIDARSVLRLMRRKGGRSRPYG